MREKNVPVEKDYKCGKYRGKYSYSNKKMLKKPPVTTMWNILQFGLFVGK